MTRRGFLTYLGVGSAALAAGSTGVLPGTAAARDNFSSAPSTPYRDETAGGFELAFDPIEATDADKLVLPAGYKFDIIRRWGEPVTADRDFGYNNDYVAYFPIDALQGGTNSEDGLLWVNHEYTNPHVGLGLRRPGQRDQENQGAMTMFLAVQHPGEETEDKDNPTSTWPHDGDNVPKPSVVAITGFV